MTYASQPSRRRKRVVDATLAALVIAFFPALVLFLWWIGWYSDLSGELGMSGARDGAVAEIERDANVVYVAAMPFGLKAKPFRVTGETLVLVGEREGGFGDLAPGTRVRVDFRERDGVHYALCVELVRNDAAGRKCPREVTPERAQVTQGVLARFW